MNEPHEPSDQHWMQQALDLAVLGQGSVEPNPMVGCVIVKNGHCIGQGYHRNFGDAHAEVDALRSLPSETDAKDATAYVTLEPCCHHGKTPPCSQALIDAEIARVVVAMRDPFPKVDGGGIAQLRQAGIEVEINVLERFAADINAPYLKRIHESQPWVIAKWAMTMDGRIATHRRESKWITSELARGEVHRLRSRVDAIITGMGTVEADDPMLTARPAGGEAPRRIAQRIVMCRRRLPSLSSKLIRSADEIPTCLFVTPEIAQNTSLLEPLAQSGAQIIQLTTSSSVEAIGQMLSHLGREKMTNVLLESGPELMGNFIDPSDGRCLIDECHVYLGAKLFGGQNAPGPIGGQGIGPVADAVPFELTDLRAIGQDVRAVYRRS